MPQGFSKDRLVVITGDGRNMELVSSFDYVTAAGEVIMVPPGTTTDGASTPPELWPTIPPFGLYWKAAFLHDYLYRCTTRGKDECDSLLREAMLWLGVAHPLAETIYAGVHWFGKASFDGDRKALPGDVPARVDPLPIGAVPVTLVPSA